MNEPLKTCLAEIHEYHTLYQNLYATLESLLKIQSSPEIQDEFIPKQSSVTEAIRCYPKDKFLYPPAGWVHPRKGKLTYNKQVWEYFFHGGGLSFFDTHLIYDDQTYILASS